MKIKVTNFHSWEWILIIFARAIALAKIKQFIWLVKVFLNFLKSIELHTLINFERESDLHNWSPVYSIFWLLMVYHTFCNYTPDILNTMGWITIIWNFYCHLYTFSTFRDFSKICTILWWVFRFFIILKRLPSELCMQSLWEWDCKIRP